MLWASIRFIITDNSYGIKLIEWGGQCIVLIQISLKCSSQYFTKEKFAAIHLPEIVLQQNIVFQFEMNNVSRVL